MLDILALSSVFGGERFRSSESGEGAWEGESGSRVGNPCRRDRVSSDPLVSEVAVRTVRKGAGVSTWALDNGREAPLVRMRGRFASPGLLVGVGLAIGCGPADHDTRSAVRTGSGGPPDAPPRLEQPEGKVQSRGVTVHQVEFQAVAPATWPSPPRGKTRSIPLILRMTNHGETPLRFKLIDTLHVSLRAEDGTELREMFARDATSRAGWFSAPVMPGKSLEINRQATLEWQADGTLRLSGPDGFGGLWWFDGLKPGRYVVRLQYENDRERADDNTLLWRGKVQTPDFWVTLSGDP